MMKAYQINEFGSAEQFKLVELPKPDVGPQEVLVAVKASSVNQIDVKIRSGMVPGISPVLPPIISGSAI